MGANVKALRYGSSVLFAVSTLGFVVSAQQVLEPVAPVVSADLVEGRRLYHQKCSVCHVAATRGEEPYGPGLSAAQVNGREESLRESIANGSVRMPGFGSALDRQQIDMIIEFLKTLASPPDRIIADAPAS